MQLINSRAMRFVVAFTKALGCTSSFSSFDRVKYIRSDVEHDQSYRNNTTTVSEGIEERSQIQWKVRVAALRRVITLRFNSWNRFSRVTKSQGTPIRR